MAKTKQKPNTPATNHRAAIRALEQVAAHEAVGAFYAACRALDQSKEMKTPVLARITSYTVIRIMREAFAYATSGGAGELGRKFRKSAKPPFPHYLRLPLN